MKATLNEAFRQELIDNALTCDKHRFVSNLLELMSRNLTRWQGMAYVIYGWFMEYHYRSESVA